jgi:hypothetical protein
MPVYREVGFSRTIGRESSASAGRLMEKKILLCRTKSAILGSCTRVFFPPFLSFQEPSWRERRREIEREREREERDRERERQREIESEGETVTQGRNGPKNSAMIVQQPDTRVHLPFL